VNVNVKLAMLDSIVQRISVLMAVKMVFVPKVSASASMDILALIALP
jgi:hypothetical protein